ncbi:DNA cytosine methyltransferase [Chromobacterium haemolyticum]|uniref:DNA cytosine methyltransferase n=1 Tax=Chromobacterium haemolyticum TaxID=394935 RepID=UPI000A02FC92
MNELALFAGAGGGILGGHLLGWRTVCAVEWEPYAAAVLAARQNDGILPPFPIWDDVRTFDGRPFRGLVDVVSGGFPCQDISAAGAGAGIDGARSGLWREMARIIGEVRPPDVLMENSPLLVGRGLAVVLGDLAALGYDAQWACISASDTEAPHQRDRIWLVAHAKGERCGEAGELRLEQPPQRIAGGGKGIHSMAHANSHDDGGRNCGGCVSSSPTKAEGKTQGKEREWLRARSGNGRQVADVADTDVQPGDQGRQSNAQEGTGGRNADRSDLREEVADSDSEREQRIISSGSDAQVWGKSGERPTGPCSYGFGGWPTEPDVGRVAHGVAARVDRLKAIGNGQVPRVAATAFTLLSDF